MNWGQSFKWVRSAVLLALWIPCAYGLFQYVETEIKQKRFETLILSNGKVSSIQRESLFTQTNLLRPGDRILSVAGERFDFKNTKELIHAFADPRAVRARVLSRGEERDLNLLVRDYSRRDLLSLVVLPALVAVIFLLFALITPWQRFDERKNREAVEVFSLICFLVSLFFLGFFPSVTLGLAWPSSIIHPAIGVLLVHLFSVYPKKKASLRIRVGVLSVGYLVALSMIVTRIFTWQSSTPSWWDLTEFFWLGACVIVAVVCLGNTLFTSRDFWTLRRAKLLSIVFVLSFTAIVGVFVSFLWEGPRISLERLLAASLFFPTFFAFIFSKENVFDLERIFRRGAHQMLFMGIAATLAILVGLGWEQWKADAERDWLLWSAIAIVVVFLARPGAVLFEKMVARFVNRKVRYPKLDAIFRENTKLESFLSVVAQETERSLGMHSVSFRLFKDPTRPWGADNEECWRWGHSKLHRVYEMRLRLPYNFLLKRAELTVGEISFSGGDGLAFDPEQSYDWQVFLQQLAGFLELIVLREFLVSQQGFLAVGRMQALLAHEMKNPLAVIKVCSGLLQDHVAHSEEAEELIRTIQQEINRVSKAVQNVFNHSGREESAQNVDLFELVEEVKKEVLARFTKQSIECSLEMDLEKTRWEPQCLSMWVQKEGLRQSLMNLLVNAFEAGSDWASIEIRLKSNHYFRISVRDRGPGIPSSIELFKPFVSSKPNGTGLGLSHVKSFVDRNSGRIQVDSSPEGGALITLEFSPQFAMKEVNA